MDVAHYVVHKKSIFSYIICQLNTLCHKFLKFSKKFKLLQHILLSLLIVLKNILLKLSQIWISCDMKFTVLQNCTKT